MLAKTKRMKKKRVNFVLLMIECPCLARFSWITEWSPGSGERIPAELAFTDNALSYHLGSAYMHTIQPDMFSCFQNRKLFQKLLHFFSFNNRWIFRSPGSFPESQGIYWLPLESDVGALNFPANDAARWQYSRTPTQWTVSPAMNPSCCAVIPRKHHVSTDCSSPAAPMRVEVHL